MACSPVKKERTGPKSGYSSNATTLSSNTSTKSNNFVPLSVAFSNNNNLGSSNRGVNNPYYHKNVMSAPKPVRSVSGGNLSSGSELNIFKNLANGEYSYPVPNKRKFSVI